MSRLLEDSQFLCLLRQLPLQAGIFSGQFTFTLRRGHLLLQLTAPRIELRFIQAKFAGGCGHTNASSQFQGFVTKFRRVLLAWLFGGWCWFCHVSHLWLRVYSLSRVSTIAG